MQKYVAGVLIFLLLVGAGYGYWKYKDKTSSFNISSDKMAQDLDGKTANVAYGQVWPFDPTQNISVKVISKKQVEDYIIVAVEISATAKVEQKDSKEKLPSKVNLKGVAKLTYEDLGHEWYLVGVDGVTLRAVPVN